MRIRALACGLAAAAGVAGLSVPTVGRASEVIASGSRGGMCLDIRGGGSDAILFQCHGGANQTFSYRPNSYGPLQSGGRCLSTNGGSPAGKPLVMVACNGGAGQEWGNPADGFLRNREGWCAEVAGGAAPQGVVAKTCNGAASQKWGYATRDAAATLLRAGRITAAQANRAASVAAGAVIDRNGNIVAQGAGNIVAQGAGNIVAQGAGNVLVPNVGIIAAGAGN